MTEVECKTKKIGGSLAVFLPKDFVDKEGIKESQTLRIELKKQIRVKDVFGILDIKTPTQKLKDEARKGW
jgi:antitoxin component of MazEF toxin-antitoxin module